MERFIVSARKYRPDTFETLVGQESIATTLKNSILRNQLAHAYLFCGPRGVGKTSSARIFAKTINCLNPGEGMTPCGECESCVSFAEGRSYSIHELDAASNNSVDDIRQLNELVRIPPQIGKYSVYIIDEVHMLSSSAFNAFLKTLEEPPPHAIFILATTEKHKILPTILSRCQTYDFNRISIEDIVRKLQIIAEKEGIEIEIEALHIIAQKADGAMRDALTIFDQAVAFCGRKIEYEKVISALNVLDYEYYIRLTNHFLNGEHSESLLIFDEILSKGFNALHFIGGLSSHFRDLLISKDKSMARLLELAPSVVDRYREQAELCSLNFLYDALSVTSACETGYKASGHQRLHIEFTLLKLCRISGTGMEQAAATARQPVTKVQQPAITDVQETPVGNTPEQTDINRSVIENQSAISDIEIDEKPLKEAEFTQQTKQTNIDNALRAEGGLSTVSLKSLRESAEANNITTSPQRETIVGSDEITQQRLAEVWVKMAESEKNSPKLYTTVSQTKPTFSGNVIIFSVKNELQKNWIEQQRKQKFLTFLREGLNNNNIDLEIVVVENSGNGDGKLYMPQEKAKFLIENYPEVKELRDDLNLELK